MTVVTGSNLYSETWNTINSLISGNVVDPILSTRTGTGKFIFGAFPDIEGRDRPSFPIIVIENPQANTVIATFDPISGNNNKAINISIWAYSKSNQQVNVLADGIVNGLLKNKLGLQGSGLKLNSVDTGAMGTDIMANDRVHFRETLAYLQAVV